jgi:hypothetical protein
VSQRCGTCGEPGVKKIIRRWYCVAHLTELYRLISPETWMAEGGGRGLPEGMRPDHGDGYADLRCACCGAG